MSTRFGRYNFTIDDSSPMITFDPANAWTDDVTADRNLRSFFQQSYHVTNQASASASLTFTGTGISIIGSKATNHDAFELRVDNQTFSGFSGFAPANQFQAVIAQVRGLRFGSHTVRITNSVRAGGAAAALLDIDAVIVETFGGRNQAGQVPSVLVDDAAIGSGNNQVTYIGNWATTSTSTVPTAFVNGTVHETTSAGASVQLNFVGDGIQVVGAVGRTASQFTVQLDETPAVTLNAQAGQFIPSSTLFFRNDLSPGSHRLVLTKVGAQGALTVDAFQVFGVGTGMEDANDLDSSVLETMPALPGGNVNNGGAGNNNRNVGAAGRPNFLLIGIIAGTAVLVLILIAGVIYYLYKRRKEKSEEASSSYNPGYGSGGGDLEAGGGLMRSNTTGTERTAVDGQSRLGGLARGLTKLVVRNPDPKTPIAATPALPMQMPGSNGNSPPMMEIGLDSGRPPGMGGPRGAGAGAGAGAGGGGGFGAGAGRRNYEDEEEAYGGIADYDPPAGGAASKFGNKGRQVSRFSSQGLSRMASQRTVDPRNEWGDGSGPSGSKARRGRFSGSTVDEWERDRYRDNEGERTPMLPPAARPKYGLGMGGPAAARRDISDRQYGGGGGGGAAQSNRRQRRSTGQFSESRYTYSNGGGGGRYSPPISEIPDTPRPRYEIDRDEVPITSEQQGYGATKPLLGRNGTVRRASNINGGVGQVPAEAPAAAPAAAGGGWWWNR